MTTERILRIKDVIAACGLSRSSIYARSNAGTFPAPVRLSERVQGWYESEVQAWIKSLRHTKTAQETAQDGAAN